MALSLLSQRRVCLGQWVWVGGEGALEKKPHEDKTLLSTLHQHRVCQQHNQCHMRSIAKGIFC